MGDGIVNEKNRISDTKYLYGVDIDELPINPAYEIAKHKEQIAKGKELVDKLYDRASRMRRRIVEVNEAIRWNELMIERLNREKK